MSYVKNSGKNTEIQTLSADNRVKFHFNGKEHVVFIYNNFIKLRVSIERGNSMFANEAHEFFENFESKTDEDFKNFGIIEEDIKNYRGSLAMNKLNLL